MTDVTKVIDAPNAEPDTTTEDEATATTDDATGTNGGTEPAKIFTQADVDRIIAKRMERAQSKAELDAEKATKVAEAKALAEQGKYQQLYEAAKAEAEQAKAEAAKVHTDALRARIARTVGLPESWADRLRGDDEDAITADAKSMLRDMPKPAAPNINASTGNGAAPKAGQPSEQEKTELAAIYGVNPKYWPS